MQKIIKTLRLVDNQNSYEEKTKTAPDPFARPVKSTSTEKSQSSEVEEDGK